MNSFRRSLKPFFIGTACVVLIGCAGPMNDPAGKTVYTAWVEQAKTANFPYDTSEKAADFVFKMKAVKDYEYNNYVTNLRRGTSWGEFGSDSIKIVLDSLVALTGSSGTKAALGGASAGVTGATASVKKNVLFDQSITTFINKMDTLRLNKWNEILCKIGRGSTDVCKSVNSSNSSYTIAEAFDDMQEYGRCGSLDAALRDVAAKTSEEKNTAEETNSKIKGE